MRFNVFQPFVRRCIFQTCLTIIVVVIVQIKFPLRSIGKPNRHNSVNQSNTAGSALLRGTIQQTTKQANYFTNITTPNNHAPRATQFRRKLLLPPASLLPFPTDDYNRPFVDKVNKLIFCYVPKNSCTQMKAAFCRKFGGIKRYNEVKQHDYIHEVCARTIVPRMKNITVLKELHRDPSWLKLAIIRDPIERFISAFVDKCQRPSRTAKGGSSKCFNFGTNFTEFVERFRWKAESYSVNNRDPHMHLFDHFMPQFWLCGFNEFYGNYRIIKMSRDNPDFPVGIKKELNKFQDWVPIIEKGWGPSGNQSFMEAKEHESPSKMVGVQIRQQLQNDLNLADIIYQIFYIDYLRFNLIVPKWISKNCQGDKMKLAICVDAHYVA